jgi:hypothetical protein
VTEGFLPMTDLAVSAALAAYGADRNAAPPEHLGTRYDNSRRFMPEPGNTVVCHVVPGSATEAALFAARARYLAMEDADRLIFTPVSSLHMTLFQGIIEYRRDPVYWPAGVPLDTGIDEMTAIMGERLAGFVPGPAFKVSVLCARPTGLVVAGATEADRRAMDIWRDGLAEVFGYRHPDHEDYVFHVTFAYLLDWLADDRLPAWQAMLDEVAADLRARVLVLDLRPPAFCVFADMNHFEELRVLA